MNKESYPEKFNLMHLLEVERTKNNVFFRTVLIEKKPFNVYDVSSFFVPQKYIVTNCTDYAEFINVCERLGNIQLKEGIKYVDIDLKNYYICYCPITYELITITHKKHCNRIDLNV